MQSFIYLVLSFLLVATLIPGGALVGLGANTASAQGGPPPLVVLPATVSVDPFSQSPDVGAGPTVNVLVENIPTVATDPIDGSTAPVGLYGAEVHLTFDPAQVQVVDANPATPATVEISPVVFGVPLANYFVAQNQADNTAGTIDFAVVLLNPQAPITAAGVLASIQFQCIAPGTSQINFASALLGGAINFGTLEEDIIPISAIPIGGEIVQGQTPPQFFTLTTDVTGSGITVPAAGVHSYPTGTVVPVTAIPAFGWTFLNWTGPVLDPGSPSTSVTIDDYKSVTANFVEGTGETFEIEMMVSPPGSGTTVPPEGLSFFPPGTVVNITATPNAGWTFVNWTGPVADPNSASTTVLMDANNKIVTANFTQSGGGTYTLNMGVMPAEGGSTAPAAGPHPGYAAGSIVPITATPAPGWNFLHWIGPVANPDNPETTVTMNGDRWVTAEFTQSPVVTLTLQANGAGGTMPGVGTHNFPEGTTVGITATPADGWQFVGWTVDPVADPNAPHTTVTMDGNKFVIANFTEGSGQMYTLTVAKTGNGNVVPGVGTHSYPAGAVIGIGGMPASGWAFDNWTGPVANPSASHTTITMDSDKSVTANFVETGPQTYTLTMGVSPFEGGIVEPSAGPHSGYAPGTQVPITATPNPGWSFLHWTGPVANPGSPSTTVTIFSDVFVTAVFTQGPTHVLNVAVNGDGGTMPGVGAHNFPEGITVALVAAPADGWQFVNWTGPVADPNNPVTTIVMDTDKSVTANFAQGSGQMYTLDVAKNGQGFVIPQEGIHTYPSGAVIGIGAQPAPGWNFVNWTGPVANPNAQHTTVVMDGNKSIAANFSEETGGLTYNLTMAVNGAGTTDPSEGVHPYTAGTVVNISATAAQGWAFVDWSGPVADANAPSTTVTMDGDKTVTANFTEQDDVPLVLAPEGNNVLVGQTFSVTISTNVPAGQQVSAVDAFIDFDPNKLEVVDSDEVTAGIQIAPGVDLPMVLINAADNTLGQIDYSAGKLSGFPTGSFLVATVNFRAKGETPFTPIAISLSGTRTSIVAYEGTNLPGTHTDSSANIVFDTPLALAPAITDTTVGQTFPVTISTNAPAGTQVSAVDAFINFDPALLEVVDNDPATPGIQIAPGVELPMTLTNEANNSLGQINFSAGKLSAFPTGSFLVATVNFRAKAEAAGTPITVSLEGERQSLVAFDGNPVPGAHSDSSANIVFDTPLSLLPAANHSYVDTEFTVSIETSASAGQQISAVDAFIDFDPGYLEVVDADPATPGIQIAPGVELPMTLTNEANNGLGQISFSAGKLSAFPTGSFLVATITFRSKAETPGTTVTPIAVSLNGERRSLVAFDGNPVPGLHADSNVDIDPGATIIGHLTLQGGSRPPAARALPLTVKLYNAGQYTGNTIMSGTPLMTYTPDTVDTGSNNVTFQIEGVMAGTYDIMIVSGHTLASVKRGVAVTPPTVDVWFGNLLEGNANNDSIINAIDFSILAATYLKSTGQAGWDARADFDRTGTVNALDFSLLAANYLKTSPREAP